MATTSTTFGSNLTSRQELAAFAGQSGAVAPQGEVVVGAPLMFGNTVPGSIHGFKYEDVNADSVYTPGTDVPLPTLRVLQSHPRGALIRKEDLQRARLVARLGPPLRRVVEQQFVKFGTLDLPGA